MYKVKEDEFDKVCEKVVFRDAQFSVQFKLIWHACAYPLN